MRKVRVVLGMLVLSAALLICGKENAEAASGEVSVTVPTNVQIVFQEDGSTAVSGLYMENQSLVPILVQNVKVTEFNQWQVVPAKEEILVNSKQISLRIQDKELAAGNNPFDYEIKEGNRQMFELQVGRGAWTEPMVSEKALEMEFVYELGTKAFSLLLDGDGGVKNVTISAKNGEVLKLPTPVREDYEFVGWKDDKGSVYNGTYTMPIGDVTLKAVWKKQTAYALFSEDDSSMTFVKTTDTIQKGQVYRGKTVTTVYTGFEKTAYTGYAQVPWCADGTNKKVLSVTVADTLKPISTAYWFYEFIYCMNYDVGKLDTSKATDMRYTFYMAGWNGRGDFVIAGTENWNTSQVTNMLCMFEFSGLMATTYRVGNIGTWDVSKVTHLSRIFESAGRNAEKVSIGDLSGWNPKSVIYAAAMFRGYGMMASSINLGNLGNWDMSSAITTYGMFGATGSNATSFYIGDLSNWNVKNVEDMSYMFSNAGTNAAWSLNCQKWNVSKVTSHNNFNYCVESKVTPPKWVK